MRGLGGGGTLKQNRVLGATRDGRVASTAGLGHRAAATAPQVALLLVGAATTTGDGDGDALSAPRDAHQTARRERDLCEGFIGMPSGN